MAPPKGKSEGRAAPLPASVPSLSNPPAGREWPQSTDAEAGLLGSCILDGGKETIMRCIEQRIAPAAFFKPAHQIIYQVLLDLHKENITVDDLVLIDRLNSRTVETLPDRQRDPEGKKTLLEFVGGEQTVRNLVDRLETRLNAAYWLEIVRQKYVLRRLIQASIEIVDHCYKRQDDTVRLLDEVEQNIFAIRNEQMSETVKLLSKVAESNEILIKTIAEKKQQPESGVVTDFEDLNRLIIGFQKGEMIVLAARPSVGKTALALSFAEHAILPIKRTPVPTVFFSLEMTAESLALRMLCSRAKVDSYKVRTGMASKDEYQRLSKISSELRAGKLFIDDSSNITIMELRARARRLHERFGIGFIIIDYLQLLAGTDARVSREQQVSEISRGIKAMAKELKVPVLVLSQLNRESEKDKRVPRLSDLRESGAIEQDADVVFLLHAKAETEDQPAQASNTRQLIVAKQRNGPVGDVTFTYLKAFTRFEPHAKSVS